MEKKSLIAVCFILLFVGTCIIPASAMNFTGKKSTFSCMNKTITAGCSSSEIELKYYMEEGLSTVIGIQGHGPFIWKIAIRLT